MHNWIFGVNKIKNSLSFNDQNLKPNKILIFSNIFYCEKTRS